MRNIIDRNGIKIYNYIFLKDFVNKSGLASRLGKV